MNAVLAVEEIAEFLSDGLRNICPNDKNGEERRVSVYTHALPDPAYARMAEADEVMPDDYEGMMPALVVAALAYDDKGLEDREALLTVSLLACAFSRDPNNQDGPRAVLNIVEEVRRLLQTFRFVSGKYECVSPLRWELFDDTRKPLWFAEVMTNWRLLTPIPTLTPELDKKDFKGDFLVNPGRR